MQMVRKADSTLDSERCSKKNKQVKIWVAALFLAVTFLVCPCFASATNVTVEGVQSWQAAIAERSLNAVAAKISVNMPDSTREKIISTIADKLFTGYRTDSVVFDQNRITVKISPAEAVPQWEVEVKAPKMQEPPSKWFNEDISDVNALVMTLVETLPVSSLSWCDNGLKDEINKRIAPMLPGWEPSFVVIAEDGKMLMQISFAPKFPLVLAVDPQLDSSTLPSLLVGDLRNDLLEQSVPFIGLPVVWMKKHAADMNGWTNAFLKNKTIVENTVSNPDTSFVPAQISKLNVRVDSTMYSLQAWTAVYAGTKDRSAEVGVHLGRRLNLSENNAVELYGEGIFQLQAWDAEYRLGAKFSPLRGIWLGGEWSSKDNQWWAKLSTDTYPHKPYIWLRVSDDGKLNTGMGWKLNGFLALELHYDARDDDMWSLRMVGNL
jgi:hypothetical protein